MHPTRVLHVEDDEIQRALIAHYLEAADEQQYVVTVVEGEDQAINAFQLGDVDLVLLDYHLAQGDGLHCLIQIRQLDPITPVIAVSGTATPEIAAELIEAGADDYLAKKSLTQAALALSIENALARARGFRAKAHPTDERLCSARKTPPADA